MRPSRPDCRACREHSEPFAEPTEITGYVSLSVWLALDCRTLTCAVSLYEVLANGASVLLAEDLMRARYRESRERARLAEPGAILPYRFETFPFFSRQVAKGSRLRLFLRCPNTIHLQKNHNSGGVVADETIADARVAT